MKIMTIVGTRPEIIRLSCVLPKLDKYTNHILVSIDSSYPEIHAKLRDGSNFDVVKNNVLNLIKCSQGSNLRISIQLLRTKLNACENVDRMEKIFGIHSNVLYNIKNAIKFVGNGDDFRVNGMNLNVSRCKMPYRMMAIGWNGDVMPCCYDADMSQTIGNCNDSKLNEIWYGKDAQKMRSKLKNFDLDGLNACSKCDQAVI